LTYIREYLQLQLDKLSVLEVEFFTDLCLINLRQRICLDKQRNLNLTQWNL